MADTEYHRYLDEIVRQAELVDESQTRARAISRLPPLDHEEHATSMARILSKIARAYGVKLTKFSLGDDEHSMEIALLPDIPYTVKPPLSDLAKEAAQRCDLN